MTDSRLDPEKVYQAILKAGEDWADAEAAAQLLEETRKTVLAECEARSESPSIAGKEMLALADPVYKEHVAGMVRARKMANKARVRYDSAKVLGELRRSEESTRREELRMR